MNTNTLSQPPQVLQICLIFVTLLTGCFALLLEQQNIPSFWTYTLVTLIALSTLANIAVPSIPLFWVKHLTAFQAGLLLFTGAVAILIRWLDYTNGQALMVALPVVIPFAVSFDAYLQGRYKLRHKAPHTPAQFFLHLIKGRFKWAEEWYFNFPYTHPSRTWTVILRWFILDIVCFIITYAVLRLSWLGSQFAPDILLPASWLQLAKVTIASFAAYRCWRYPMAHHWFGH